MTLLVVSAILQAVLIVVAVVLTYHVKSFSSKIEAQDTKIASVEKDNKEIKDNYLDRFEKVNTNIRDVKDIVLEAVGDSKEELTKTINDVKLDIAKKTTVRRAAKK